MTREDFDSLQGLGADSKSRTGVYSFFGKELSSEGRRMAAGSQEFSDQDTNGVRFNGQNMPSGSKTQNASKLSPIYAMDIFLNNDELHNGNYTSVKDLLLKTLASSPYFSSSDHQQQDISIEELKGGITNQLLRGKYCGVEFLVRSYGKGTDTIINRDREYATHMLLTSHGLAPPLYVRFGNGLVYGFQPGRVLHYTELSSPEIMSAVASRLAQWHAILDQDSINNIIAEISNKSDRSSVPFSKDIWELMEKWIEVMPENIVPYSRQTLQAELSWARKMLEGSSPNVVGHCDLLSGNILVPEKWKSTCNDLNGNTKTHNCSNFVTFIDYEYAMPSARAFDISNHFMEWQGFDCKTELIPELKSDSKVLRYWLRSYLESYHEHSSNQREPISDDEVTGLISELKLWWGIPGFYWGVWAAIQASISEIDFNYADYASKRLDEYFNWKVHISR